MPEFEPFILLPAQQTEFTRKRGGGGAKAPIVPVTRELRTALIGQLSEAKSAVAGTSPLANQGIPLAITIREEALAKTKRPYGLLESVDLPPVAAERPGELVSRATPQSLDAFESALGSRDSKADIYAISTIQSLRIWDPIEDALHLGPRQSPQQLLDEARDRELPLRVELFPWLSSQSLLSTEAETLGNYLDLLGLPVKWVAGDQHRTTLYLQVTSSASVEALSGLYGVRSAGLSPSYSVPESVRQQAFRSVAACSPSEIAGPENVRAAVGILDTGIAAASLEPWVRGRWRYDIGHEFDPLHGTFVGGLVVAAQTLNDGCGLLPADRALIYDGQVMPNGPISEYMLIERVSEVLDESGPNGPRVWNCSFNSNEPLDPAHYTAFGQEMDLMAQEHGVLFVQSAGNYDDLRSAWPPDGSDGAKDAITSPADAITSLTVGALSHLPGGKTPLGAVSSYSRRGPSFGGQQKPDLTHYAGDVDANNRLAGFGIKSVGPDDGFYESVGTSFSTPLVSAVAANVWQDLLDGQGVHPIDPSLVKALVVHSAAVANTNIPDHLRTYYGAGVPRGGSAALFDVPHTFSTIHEVDLKSGVNWEKRPFPMPEAVYDPDDGKLRAAVTLTLCFKPFIDAAFGAESVRTCVEPSFGRYQMNVDGKEEFSGKMGGSHDWEKHLIERGKWSPIKTYRKVWRRGTEGTGDWALKLRLTARDSSIEPLIQRAYVIVTIEGLDRALPIRQDGLRALAALRYPSSLIVDAGRVRIGNRS